MLTLAFESSAKAASVALLRDGQLLAQYFQNSGLTHSRTLMKLAQNILQNNELTVAGLSNIAVSHGPGSFTGIRIGIAAAKGLAFGAEIPVRGVSTLRAAASVFDNEDVILCPVMDARRGEVYNALFERRDSELKRLCDDRALPASELAEEARRSEKPFLLIGDGAELCREVFSASGIPARLAPEMTRLQCAYGVALASLDVPDMSAGELEPNYLRVSQAERLRQEK